MSRLRLEKITYLNWHDVEDLHVTREQEDYLADNSGNEEILAVLKLERENKHG